MRLNNYTRIFHVLAELFHTEMPVDAQGIIKWDLIGIIQNGNMVELPPEFITGSKEFILTMEALTSHRFTQDGYAQVQLVKNIIDFFLANLIMTEVIFEQDFIYIRPYESTLANMQFETSLDEYYLRTVQRMRDTELAHTTSQPSSQSSSQPSSPLLTPTPLMLLTLPETVTSSEETITNTPTDTDVDMDVIDDNVVITEEHLLEEDPESLANYIPQEKRLPTMAGGGTFQFKNLMHKFVFGFN